ncbi:MAG: cupin domain-containing protein [Haloarculaceae archaeon]
MSDDFDIVHYESLESDRFPVSEVEHWKLTEALGAEDARVNVVRLEPGDSIAAHTHERQEELYVTTTGGQVRIEGETYDVPAETVVRVGPDSVRNVTNETDDETHVWVMFGAPPVGTVDDFGEYRLPDEK